MSKQIFRLAKAIALASLMSFVVIPSKANAQGKEVTLKAGMPISLTTMTNANSDKLSSGSTVDFKVVSDVKVNGDVVIPAGSIAKGQVTHVSKSAALGKGGDLTISINSVNAIDGSMIPVSGATISATGDNNTGLAVVCGLFTLFGFLIPGEAAEIPAGAQVQAAVMANTTITL